MSRRVETVEFISRVAIERCVSLDIDVTELVRRAEKAGFVSPKRVYFPLTLLRKVILTDLDVRDEDNGVLSVVTSDQDSHAAHALLLEAARKAGFDPAGFRDTIVQKLYEIVFDSPSKADRIAIERGSRIGGIGISAWSVRRGVNLETADQKLWNGLFSSRYFVAHAAQLTVNYLPIVSVATDAPPSRVIKFRTVEPLTHPPKLDNLRQRLGVSPGLFQIAAPSVGRAQREHLQIVAPGGTFLVSSTLAVPPDPSRRATGLAPQTAGAKYKRRLTLERAILYSRETTPGPYLAYFGLKPSLQGFQAPAIIALVLNFILLGFGAASQWLDGTLEKIAAEKSESAVTLLLFVPTLAIAYIVREGEHDIRAHLLYYLRWMVGIVGIFTIAAATALICGAGSPIMIGIWAFGAGYCLIVLAVVIYAGRISQRKRDEIFRDSGEQADVSIQILR
ncbi:hypothetical protein [Mycobacteroides abscessus]|uniref:hypothetical protein n=1 Tax=Mycobacteroides abscessus TaxID=36809 RepID=UPI0010570725|nr:hypothetical protein [Mycobacteroides abscessus]